jgi:hypothetical protein
VVATTSVTGADYVTITHQPDGESPFINFIKSFRQVLRLTTPARL